MAKYIRGNIAFTPVVEQINRKFAPKDQTCTAAKKVGPVTLESNSWMGAATRVNERGGLGETRKNYFVFRENARMSAISENEINARGLFESATKGAYRCRQNLSYIARMLEQFKQSSEDHTKVINGVSAKGYTFAGWTVAVQYAGKKADNSYDVNVWPNGFDA